ncbi:prolipoprotein diacylglyceryl transferase [Patescibacteria group bacterium]|nr:prolipoprotein diacylglyceryl transferase [Patescibacteria group bacterium]
MNIYGLLIGSATFVCLLVGEKIVRRENLNPNTYWGCGLSGLLGGVIGARLYHVIDYWGYYSRDLLEILKVYNGGLGIFGAIAGGILSIAIYLKYKREPILKWLDLASILLPLGQSIGRWGNYFNNEVLGTPTNLPWKMAVASRYRPPEMGGISYYHPLFLYESILDFGLFLLLVHLYKSRKLKLGSGKLLILYLCLYALIRTVLQPMRLQ